MTSGIACLELDFLLCHCTIVQYAGLHWCCEIECCSLVFTDGSKIYLWHSMVVCMCNIDIGSEIFLSLFISDIQAHPWHHGIGFAISYNFCSSLMFVKKMLNSVMFSLSCSRKNNVLFHLYDGQATLSYVLKVVW